MAQNTLPLSATGQAIAPGSGEVTRIIVNTHSSGVIKLVDSPNSTSGRVMLGDYTLPSGAQTIPLRLPYSSGVHFILVSGSATVQLEYDPTTF